VIRKLRDDVELWCGGGQKVGGCETKFNVIRRITETKRVKPSWGKIVAEMTL